MSEPLATHDTSVERIGLLMGGLFDPPVAETAGRPGSAHADPA